MAIQRLTAAYRSRSRPSSTPGAKASTVCPSYLDGDRRIASRQAAPRSPVIPVRTALCEAVLRWHDRAVFKVREEARARSERRGLSKLNSMRPRGEAGGRQVRSTLGTGRELAPHGLRGGRGRRSMSWSFPRKEV